MLCLKDKYRVWATKQALLTNSALTPKVKCFYLKFLYSLKHISHRYLWGTVCRWFSKGSLKWLFQFKKDKLGSNVQIDKATGYNWLLLIYYYLTYIKLLNRLYNLTSLIYSPFKGRNKKKRIWFKISKNKAIWCKRNNRGRRGGFVRDTVWKRGRMDAVGVGEQRWQDPH